MGLIEVKRMCGNDMMRCKITIEIEYLANLNFWNKEDPISEIKKEFSNSEGLSNILDYCESIKVLKVVSTSANGI